MGALYTLHISTGRARGSPVGSGRADMGLAPVLRISVFVVFAIGVGFGRYAPVIVSRRWFLSFAVSTWSSFSEEVSSFSLVTLAYHTATALLNKLRFRTARKRRRKYEF